MKIRRNKSLINHVVSPFPETPWPEDEKEALDEEDEDAVVYQNGDSHHVDEQLPTLTLAHVKFEPTKSCIVGCVYREHDSLLLPSESEEPVAVPDTIEAHLELVRERESKLKMKEEVWDQVISKISANLGSCGSCCIPLIEKICPDLNTLP